jgi:hypothetical protein
MAVSKAKNITKNVDMSDAAGEMPTFKPAKITLEPTKLLTLDLRTITVCLEGVTPFISHAWDPKNLIKMQEKQAGAASKGREKRNPEADYEAAFYKLPDESYGIKCGAFKMAAVTAVTSLGKEFTKVGAKQAFFILRTKDGGELTKIHYPSDCPPYMRTDTVTVGMGGTDLRYRPEFPVWGVKLDIQYNARAISQDQLLNLINLGGFSVGVGEWRPERSGDFGRFRVVNNLSWEK